MNERCLELAEAGYTVLVASNRLAQRMQYEFARRRVRTGAGAWESPDIVPLSAWLERTWNETRRFAPDELLLLSPAQALCVWRRIIADSGYGANLLHPGAVARQALDAWETLCAWRLPPARPDRLQSEDVRAFAHWAGLYAAHCAERGWQDPAGLAGQLQSAFATGAIAAPARLALIGFDAPEPQLIALTETLKARGSAIEWIAPGTRSPAVRAQGYADRRAEIRGAAQWVRTLIGERPGATVGVVMPDLAAARRTVEYEFDDALMPGALLQPPDGATRPYSIALGNPLAGYPVIAAALLVLRALLERVPVHEIGRLLRSPFLGDAEAEGPDRAALDAWLRRRGGFHYDLNSLVLSVDRFHSKHGKCERLLGRLRSCAEFLRAARRTQSTAAWAQLYSQVLKLIGWPGQRAPDSDEYQCLQSWHDALSELASLDPLLPRQGAAPALAELQRIAMQQRFQPRTGEAPVQIIGMLGAAGMQFDHLWIMGMQQELWPGRAQPNPFIPIRVQREQRMPHASPEIELAHARAVTVSLIASASEVVLSHPRNDGDRPLRPSPLIAAYLRDASVPAEDGRTSYAAAIQATRASDLLLDQRAPSVPDDRVQAGGAALFRDQAACPFRSFARHRLRARAPEEVDAGLGAQERGSLVHRAMQGVWEALQSHAGLTAAGDEKLDEVINAAADAALNWIRGRRAGGLAPRFAQLERARLRRILREWLAYESGRPPFAVESCEREQQARFAGLQIRIRMDRVDRLADGRHALIDYKTGEAKSSAWLGERPDEPQLPLYAVAGGVEVAAAAFAQIQTGTARFSGVSAEPDALPGVEALAASKTFREFGNWENLLDHWRTVLTRLADEFRAGDARVMPKGPQTCRLCDLHALCRVHETGADEQADDDE